MTKYKFNENTFYKTCASIKNSFHQKATLNFRLKKKKDQNLTKDIFKI